MSFLFNLQKNKELLLSRGVGFEEVILGIQNGFLLDILPHPNTNQYPGQWIMIVEINEYAYQVPFKYESNDIRLITVFPSRKCTRKYLEEKP